MALGRLLYFALIAAVSHVSLGLSRPALFLIGDSVAFRIYEHGVVPLCGGSTSSPDSRTNLALEDLQNHPNSNLTGRLCNSTAPFSRVGCSFHWGVSPEEPYHVRYLSHRYAHAPGSSVEYMLLAAREFAQRAAGEDMALLLSSCHWDTARYKDFFWDELPPGLFLREYKANLTAAVAALQAALAPEPRHRLFLQTTPNGWTNLLRLHPEHLNTAMREVGRQLNVTVVDTGDRAGYFCPRDFYADETHPTPEATRELAKHMTGIVTAAFAERGKGGGA